MGYWVSCPLDSQNLNFSVAFSCSKSDSECVVVRSSQRRGTVCYNSVCSVQQLLQFSRPTAVPPRKKSWRRHCWKRLFSAGHMDSCIARRPVASVRYGEMRWWCSDIPLSWTADGRYYATATCLAAAVLHGAPRRLLFPPCGSAATLHSAIYACTLLGFRHILQPDEIRQCN